MYYIVSTHSRLKAAGYEISKFLYEIDSFNTQPPEGGWEVLTSGVYVKSLFQHTAA